MIEKKLLWFFLVGLIAVDASLLWQKGRLDRRLAELEDSAREARIEQEYADEQEALVLGPGLVSPGFHDGLRATTGGDGVQFVLFASLDDCMNCIEDEVEKLNEIVRCASPRVDQVRGFLLDEHRREQAEALLAQLSYAPIFPLSIRFTPRDLAAGASTPLVLVVRSRDGKILDAHKPIPQNLTRRDTFYTRWLQALAECAPAA